MFSLLKHRTSIFWTSLIILLLCILAYSTGVFYKFDRMFVNRFSRFKYFTNSKKSSDIAIVEVDGEILEKGELWPWGKEWYPYFVNLLYSYNPKGILLLTPSCIKKSFSDNTVSLNTVNSFNVVNMDIDSVKDIVSRSDIFYKIPILDRYNNRKINKQTLPLIKLVCAYYGCDFKDKDFLFFKDNYITIKKAGVDFLKIPVVDDNLIINLTTGQKFFHYGYFDILVKAQRLNTMSEVDLKDLFKDKIIIFSDNKAIYNTPLCKLTRGEVLANVLYAIIGEKFIKKGYILDIPFIFFIGILLFILLSKFNFSGRTLTWLLSFIGILGFCYFLFFGFGIVITVVTPLLLITLLYVNISIYGFHQQRSIKIKQKKQLLAREIKRRIIPNNIGRIPGVDLQVGMVESSEVGGDFYNLVKISESELVIVMGTVSESGLNAAQQIENMVTKFKVMYNKNTKMPSLCSRLNRDLIMEAREGHFVKLLIANINFSDGLVKMVNSGQVPPFIIYPHSLHIRRIKSAEPVPLGIYSERRFDEQVFRLNKGDVFVILSEGMYETFQTVVDYNKIFSDRNKKISYFVDKVISESKKTNEGNFNKDRTLIVMRKL